MCELLKSSGFWGLVGTIIGGLITYYSQLQMKKRDSIQLSYANLYGLRRRMKQIYLSHFEATIFSDAHEAYWRISGHTSTVDYNESIHWMRESADLLKNVSTLEQELAQACGALLFNFKSDADFAQAVKNLLKHPVPKLTVRGSGLTTTQEVYAWQIKAVADLQNKVEEIFEDSFNAVLNHNVFENLT